MNTLPKSSAPYNTLPLSPSRDLLTIVHYTLLFHTHLDLPHYHLLFPRLEKSVLHADGPVYDALVNHILIDGQADLQQPSLSTTTETHKPTTTEAETETETGTITESIPRKERSSRCTPPDAEWWRKRPTCETSETYGSGEQGKPSGEDCSETSHPLSRRE